MLYLTYGINHQYEAEGGNQMKTQKNFTLKQYSEDGSSFYLDYTGNESKHPCPMTFKQAKFLAREFCGFIVTYDAWIEKIVRQYA